MKIVVSAYECNPLRGSDSFVGWSYIINAAKYNEIYAFTRTQNKKDIEHYLTMHEVPYISNIHFVYVDQSAFFTNILYKLNHYLGFLGSYVIWQSSIYKRAKRMHKNVRFDVAHHISIADYRVVGKLWKLNIPFILGPVGGAQITPDALRSYTKGYEKSERIRELLNRYMVRMPSYKRAVNNAKYVFVSNDETANAIKAVISESNRWKVIQKTELCINKEYLIERESLTHDMPDNETVHIIVSGRLIYRKGISLLLDAVEKVRTKNNYVVDIYGDGPQRKYLENTIKEKRISSNVILHGKVDFAELQNRYKTSDILILPSLRETTGTAVVEAMANKLPIISLNQNGVKALVGTEAGILVNIQTKEQIVVDLAKAIEKLVDNLELRLAYGNRAFDIIKEKYTWDRRAEEMNDLYVELCREDIKK